MRKRMIGIVSTAAALTLVAGGTVTAIAATGGLSGGGNDDSSTAITGPALDRATAAAIAAAGPGTVTESEAGGDEAAYEIELKLDAGGSVDVRLDSSFTVTGVSSNDEQGDDHGKGADDSSNHNEGPQGDGDGETADD
ncbi:MULTISPECIES: hypothetical protein [Microbacterium]|uniref:YpeB-like protein with protease inhibitory function n=1 Tax=Microbacterium kyungheense TaxID=1263636 RepID=A0A543F0R8_9MICO|nr:hypothetical protein [Microbacterium kyungheense]TQM27380.1 hypothetical protein FB391_1393 [Microbacterium kyungheense]